MNKEKIEAKLSEKLGFLTEAQMELLKYGFTFFYVEPERITDDVKLYLNDVLMAFFQEPEDEQQRYIDSFARVSTIDTASSIINLHREEA